MGRYDRNPYPYPLIKDEEGFKEPLMLPGYEYDWKDTAPVHERLYLHNTLASIRQNRLLRHPFAPKDSLDLALTTVYDQGKDSFLPKSYVFIQPEVVGLPSRKLLKNVRYVPDVRPARDLHLDPNFWNVPVSTTPIPGTRYYGLRIGGVKEKKSVFSVKLGIPSFHSSTSNAGYSRKDDGTCFHS